VIADQNSVRAAKVTAVLIKRCRAVLTERCRYITKKRGRQHAGERGDDPRDTQVRGHMNNVPVAKAAVASGLCLLALR
jgi:hypothetical protein